MRQHTIQANDAHDERTASPQCILHIPYQPTTEDVYRRWKQTNWKTTMHINTLILMFFHPSTTPLPNPINQPTNRRQRFLPARERQSERATRHAPIEEELAFWNRAFTAMEFDQLVTDSTNPYHGLLCFVFLSSALFLISLRECFGKEWNGKSREGGLLWRSYLYIFSCKILFSGEWMEGVRTPFSICG